MNMAHFWCYLAIPIGVKISKIHVDAVGGISRPYMYPDNHVVSPLSVPAIADVELLYAELLPLSHALAAGH